MGAKGFNPSLGNELVNIGILGPPAGTALRFQATLIGAFALVATLLAATGLSGSVAHAVGRRRRELGIRMVLGANRTGVLGLVFAQGMRLTVGWHRDHCRDNRTKE